MLKLALVAALGISTTFAVADITAWYPTVYWSIIICYSVAFALLFFYYAVEDSFIHASSVLESKAKLTIIGLLQFPDVMSSYVLWDNRTMYAWINTLIRLILCLHLLQLHGSTIPQSEKSVRRRNLHVAARQEKTTKTSYLAQRFTYEMEYLLEEMVRARSVGGVLDSSLLVHVSYLLLLLSHGFAWLDADVRLSTGTTVGHVCKFLYIALLIYALVWTFMPRRSSRYSKRLRALISRLSSLADDDTLNCIFANVNVVTLVDVADWPSVKMLADHVAKNHRLDEWPKGILIDAIQKKGLSHTVIGPKAIETIVCSCNGKQLTALKNNVDVGGDYYNLFKLIYVDIKNKKVQEKILSHIKAQAQELRRNEGPQGVKILSDVDDTLYCSAGHFPAGVDKRFPKRTVYPGCCSLYRALDKTGRDKAGCCNLVFLSARPHVFKDVSEKHSYELFDRLVTRGQMHTMPTLLPGELVRGVRAFLTVKCLGTAAWSSVGEYKASTYEKYRDLYPEYDTIFFGDNGQGDLLTGERIRRNEEASTGGRPRARSSRAAASDATTSSEPGLSPRQSLAQNYETLEGGQQEQKPRFLGAVIHEVFPEEQCLSLEPASERGAKWRANLREKGIIFHKSYVGAALALHEIYPDVISVQDVVDVVDGAIDEFDQVRLLNANWGEERWQEAEQDLRADIERANVLVRDSGREQLKGVVRTRKFKARWDLAARVTSKAQLEAVVDSYELWRVKSDLQSNPRKALSGQVRPELKNLNEWRRRIFIVTSHDGGKYRELRYMSDVSGEDFQLLCVLPEVSDMSSENLVALPPITLQSREKELEDAIRTQFGNYMINVGKSRRDDLPLPDQLWPVLVAGRVGNIADEDWIAVACDSVTSRDAFIACIAGPRANVQAFEISG